MACQKFPFCAVSLNNLHYMSFFHTTSDAVSENLCGSNMFASPGTFTLNLSSAFPDPFGFWLPLQVSVLHATSPADIALLLTTLIKLTEALFSYERQENLLANTAVVESPRPLI